MENLPASLSRQNAAIRKFVENYDELKMNGQSKESKMEENIKFMQCDNLENANSPSRTSPTTFSVGNLSQPVKVSYDYKIDLIDAYQIKSVQGKSLSFFSIS